MNFELLDARRMFSVLAANFNTTSQWSSYMYDTPDYGDFALLAANFNQVYGDLPRAEPVETEADLNGDHLIDLTDFYHFSETAVDSQANNLIRDSAGPGDSDCDGRIDKYDIRALGANFNNYGNWQNGDFTMNGRVTIQDFALAAANVLAD